MSERATVLQRSEKRGASERPAFSRREEEHRGSSPKVFSVGFSAGIHANSPPMLGELLRSSP